MASVVDLKSKEEKDAELDRRIEALRKKNEALMKRHKLIEEDRKMAEQEGNAVTTPRKIKISDGEPDKARKEKENFSITLDVSAGEKRIVSEGKSPRGSHTPTRTKTSPRSPTQRASVRTGAYPGGRSPQFDRSGETFKFDNDDNIHPSERMERGRRRQGAEAPNRGPWVAKEGPSVDQWTPSSRGGRGPSRGRGGDTPGRGGGPIVNTEGTTGTDRKVKEWEEKRKQNIEKMNEEMEQIAEYERHQRDGVREKNPIRNFLDDPRRTGPIADVDRKEGSRRHTRNWGGTDFEKVKTGMDREKESHVRRPGGRNQMDMTMSMTGRERAEYVRWKQEREQIDQERLARHRKPTGQWRREWDAEKTDTMFKDGSTPQIEDEPMGRRELDKRGAPKPTTMAEFIPRSLQSSGEKRDQKRGRGRNKPYSMHDSRWEDDDDEEEEEVNEKDKMLPVEEKEKEMFVEEPVRIMEETKVEGAQKNAHKTPKPMVDEKKDEFKHVKVECEEGEEDDDDDDEDEEEWTDASGDEEEEDGSEVEEDSIEEATPATPKEQRLPQQRETPKLTMPPPNVNSEEGAVESKPTSPFSPDGHQPVTDWGEEMELLSPPGSSNEDSPPQVVNRKVFTMDSRSHSESTQNPTLDPEGVVASNVESSSLQTPEVQSGQKHEPVASNVESRSLQSPEVQTDQKQEPVASDVEYRSLQSPEVQTDQKQEHVASDVESSSLQSPEVQSGQKQEPVASNVEYRSLQYPEVQSGQKQEPLAPNVESSSLQSPEVQSGQKQEPVASDVESCTLQSPEVLTDQKQEPVATNVESSSLQSPEVQSGQKQEPVASNVESRSLQSPEVQSGQKQEHVASDVESCTLQSPEVQSGQKQEPVAPDVESCTLQSPEVMTDQKQEPVAPDVESSSLQSHEVQSGQKQEPVASDVESCTLQSPEVLTDQKQEPVNESSGGEPLPGAPVLSQERDPDNSKNQGERVEEISAVPAETSLAVEEASSVQEQSSPVQEQSSPVKEQSSPVQEQSSPVKEQSSPSTGEALPVKDETTPPPEDLEGTIKAVHIADFETSPEMSQSS